VQLSRSMDKQSRTREGILTAGSRPRLCAAMFGQPTVDAEPLGQPGGTADFRPRLCAAESEHG
jgi:hypothetical protein